MYICMYACILFLLSQQWRKQKQQLRQHRLRIIYCEWATSSGSSSRSSSLVSATHTNTKVASTQKIVKHHRAPSCASDTNTNATIVCIYTHTHIHTHTPFMSVCFLSSSLAHTLWREHRRKASPTPTNWSLALNASYAQLSAAYLGAALFYALLLRRSMTFCWAKNCFLISARVRALSRSLSLILSLRLLSMFLLFRAKAKFYFESCSRYAHALWLTVNATHCSAKLRLKFCEK